MPFRMDLVAGDRTAILAALALAEPDGAADFRRLPVHLPLGGPIDPTWLDRFSEAVRRVTGADDPCDLLDARHELDGPGETEGRAVEAIDTAWVSAIARLDERRVDAVAGAWIELLEEDLGELPREEKPWIRGLAADIVRFCRRADVEADVILAWSL